MVLHHHYPASDSLQYSPERCTIVACYKRIVVGVVLLSSPLETYITYLAVRSGWENARIATYVPGVRINPPFLLILSFNSV
jgi:hypothetical protein